MINKIRNKYIDIYSYIEHFVWKNEEDIFWYSLLLLVCILFR